MGPPWNVLARLLHDVVAVVCATVVLPRLHPARLAASVTEDGWDDEALRITLLTSMNNAMCGHTVKCDASAEQDVQSQ